MTQVRATRAYIAGFGTAGSLLAGAAILFVLASAVVSFRGWPTIGAQPSPSTVILAKRHTAPAGSPAVRRVALVAAASSAAAAGPTGAGATGAGAIRRAGGSGGAGTGGRGSASFTTTGRGSSPGSQVHSTPTGLRLRLRRAGVGVHDRVLGSERRLVGR